MSILFSLLSKRSWLCSRPDLQFSCSSAYFWLTRYLAVSEYSENHPTYLESGRCCRALTIHGAPKSLTDFKCVWTLSPWMRKSHTEGDWSLFLSHAGYNASLCWCPRGSHVPRNIVQQHLFYCYLKSPKLLTSSFADGLVVLWFGKGWVKFLAESSWDSLFEDWTTWSSSAV